MDEIDKERLLEEKEENNENKRKQIENEHVNLSIEVPWIVIEKYFEGKHLKRLVRHQLESFNYFVHDLIPKTIDNFNNNIKIRSEKDYFPEFQKYAIELEIFFDNFQLDRPKINENNGAIRLLFPQDARLRNVTYASTMLIDIQVKYTIRTGDRLEQIQTAYKKFPNIQFGKLPVMLKSDICTLTQHSHLKPEQTGECKFDAGGYFIINGSEKTVLGQERTAENKIFVYRAAKNKSKLLWTAEIKCVAVTDFKCNSPKQIILAIHSKSNGFGHPIHVQLPRLKQSVPLFVMFRALGVESDKGICDFILLHVNDSPPILSAFLEALHASIMDAKKYMTKEAALRYICSYIIFSHSIQNLSSILDKEAYQQKKMEYTEEVIFQDLFCQCQTLPQKICFLGYMTKKIVEVKLGYKKSDDRDSYLNKRIDLVGTLLNGLFRNSFHRMVKEMEKQVIREINTGAWKSRNDVENILNEANIDRMIKTSTVENGFKNALATGNFSIKQNTNSKLGVGQVLSRLTYASSLSHSRRINAPIEKSGKMVEPRKLHGSCWGYMCPAETPEGQSIGLVKNCSYLVHITIPSNVTVLYEKIVPLVQPLTSLPQVQTTMGMGMVNVFINGAWIGTTTDPETLYHTLKNYKFTGILNVYTSVVFDYQRKEIRVCNDSGRVTRPLFRVKKNQLLLTAEIILQIYREEVTWEHLLTNAIFPEAIIEYLDSEEQNAAMIATTPQDLLRSKIVALKQPTNTNNNQNINNINNNNNNDDGGETFYQFTHCEIHPSTIFGILASCIPFPEFNQSPRNCYQCAQSKQAIGVYVTNYHLRMDKTAYVLSQPTRPLVDTRMMNILQLHKIPSGNNVIVAIMTHTGYNQEDSILFNKGAIDRGLFMATIYHTEKDEGSNSVNCTEEIRCKPDPSITKGMKIGANYNKVNQKGLIPENVLVNNRDIIISKVLPINKNEPTKQLKYEDHSVMYRSSVDEETYVDKNYIDKNGNGYPISKTRLRTLRFPVVGDKFSSRHGQKGTIGSIIPEADMPFTANGVRPDIIINPHAIPSRMTIGQLKETLLGKVCLQLGLFGDGTPFHSLSVKEICAELLKNGYNAYGNEILYNGMTGQMFSCSVFIGPCFYQRLKHMVKDKIHSRANGRMVNLTRQPAEGRSRDGGLRIGEMEKDCMASHGADSTIRERMYDASDRYSVHICNRCGLIACFNEELQKHHCRTCDNRTDFSYVEIPYAFKLGMQELLTMNIATRILT